MKIIFKKDVIKMKLQSKCVSVLVTILVLGLMAGCGSGGSTTPPVFQYGTAEGFVKDAVTRTGIEEAIVTTGGKSNITDSNGAYLIENIPVGSQSIVVTALGYQDYDNSVTIEEGDNVIDDVLLEPGATHYEGTSNSDGIATFTLQDGRIVQTKVIDVVTGEPIPNIDSYLVTDGTDVAFLFIDPAGIYIPRIAPEEQSLRTLARSPEERAVGTIKELWKIGEALFSGYQPKYADQIGNRFASYIFRTFFIFCFPSTLGDLETSLWEFLVESGLNLGVEVAITAVIPGANLALLIVVGVEFGNTMAYELWVEHYTSRGYSLEQNFEVWRINPLFLSVFTLVPFVFPIEEPSGSIIEENPGSISGKVLDARTGEGIYDAQVQIVDLDLCTTTSSDGSYNFNSVPPGTYGIVATKAGYYPSVQINVTVISEATAVDVNLVLSSILASTEYRIVLTWGENPRDLDSHLWTPPIEGTSYHIAYYSMGDLDSPPYAALDVDDVTSYGPETITITDVYSGTYTYAVKHYAGSGKITTSGAKVEVYDDSGKIRTYEVDPNALCGGVDWYWTVFELDGNSGAITTINTFNSYSPRYVNDKELLFEKK